jgi:hypothetical protein
MRRFLLFLLCGAIVAALLPAAASPQGLPALSRLLGLSGQLRAVFALPGEVASEGVRVAGLEPIRLIILKPFSAKVRGSIGPYRLGTWPYERSTPPDPAYRPPRGFIEVTPENFALRVSEHFTLGQFVTKNQTNVWPKYVALERRLLDKLELVISELEEMGHPVNGLHVMSGFRTPEYNAAGVGEGGRSAVSRHQYGDAADVFPDRDSNGWTDDLSGDGRVDLRDARILAEAAERVERDHPELAGGIGIYPATRAHGPMVHIDVRGKRARWGG